jgi:hypothetical protein
MKTKEIEFVQVKKVFSMTCKVEAKIHATAEDIWELLTDAKGFSKWNSTVSAIDGNICEGERIRIHVPGTNRTFKPKVSDVKKNKQMTWSNGFIPFFRGSRTFELIQCKNGSTNFIMEEHFSGLMFALIKNRLPDFRMIFETYALDLKNEAERVASLVPHGYQKLTG